MMQPIRYIWRRMTGKYVEDVIKNIVEDVAEKLILKNIDIELAEHYFKGYIFHQNEVKNDDELFQWVIKKNYLDS